MTMVYIRHIRKAKFCAAGTRKFFIKNGLDYSDFIKNGILAERLIETGDAMAYQVVEIAENEQRQQQRADDRV